MISARHIVTALVLGAGIVGFATADSNINVDDKYAWGENVGWLNFRDANGTAQGVQVLSDHLSGFVWAENVGWINVGNGSGPYANTDGTNFGVNVGAGGNLTGFAWGENIGWINFDGGAMATPAQPARIDSSDPMAMRFRGYAWGENIGWINLDDPNAFVGIEDTNSICQADFDNDGDVDLTDFGTFGAAFGSMTGDANYNAAADFDNDGDVDLTDFGTFGSEFGNDASICDP